MTSPIHTPCLRLVFQSFALSSAVVVFFKSTFSKYSFRITIRVSNNLDPDQAQCIVRPDLDLTCLQKLSTDDISR